jgi:uncharacterized membrane protein (DUF4010 family)
VDGNRLQLSAQALALLAALAAGLVIGLERGWQEREAADGRRIAGLRTFALLGLLGGVCMLVGPALLAAGALGLSLLCTVSYREGLRATRSLSATSAIAQMLTFSLGAFAAAGAPVLAMSAAVIVAVLLDLRSTLHRGLRLIEHGELKAALQMLVLSAVVLPVLPDAGYGPQASLNPYRLWWAVVLVAGLSLLGHVAMRVSGARRGVLWMGLLGGLASSTAATMALARRLREHPALLHATTAGVLGACAMMFLRISVIVLVLAPPLAPPLLPPLLCTAASLFALALLHWRRERAAGDPPGAEALQPFDLGTALGFGAFLGVVSVLAALMRERLGVHGLYSLAMLSGLVDVDAITISMTRLAGTGTVQAPVVATTVALAVLTNTLTKVVLAWVTGGWPLGLRVALSSLLAMAPGAVLVWLT